MSRVTRIKKTLASKFFWVSLVMASLVSLGNVAGMTTPDLFYLQIPMAAIVLGTLPSIASMVFSIRFAFLFMWFHRNILHFKDRHHITYTSNNGFVEKESYRNYALSNIWYSLGITFFLLQFLELDAAHVSRLTVAVVGFVLLAIIFASGLTFSTFLISKKGIFFENKRDGSKVNLASDYKNTINSFLAPVQIAVILYVLFVEKTILPVLISLGTTLLLCFLASITSYFILKKHYVSKIYSRFESRLYQKYGL